MGPIRVCVVFLLSFFLAASLAAAEFPPGTRQFLNTNASSAIPAAGGGIWAATPQGVVRYTEGGAGVTLATPGGAPRHLVLAADGSIWFETESLIGRISTAGGVLEQYPIAGARSLAVASDGALWYVRNDIIWRIAGGVPTAFLASPPSPWSLAAASDGQMWVLGAGIGTSVDSLYKMTSTGSITTIPLGRDVLGGQLQALPDGTLYIGTGIRHTILRLETNGQLGVAAEPPGSNYRADPTGNLWLGDYGALGYIGRFGVPNVMVEMPSDPRQHCSNIPAYAYNPIAIDSAGGLWVQIYDGAFYSPLPIPCTEPEPPPMPDLIRIDIAQFLAANAPATPAPVPTLSPIMLVALAIGLAIASKLRW